MRISRNNCEAKAKRTLKVFLRSEARRIRFAFAIFRNKANSQCEFGSLVKVITNVIFKILSIPTVYLWDNFLTCSIKDPGYRGEFKTAVSMCVSLNNYSFECLLRLRDAWYNSTATRAHPRLADLLKDHHKDRIFTHITFWPHPADKSRRTEILFCIT